MYIYMLGKISQMDRRRYVVGIRFVATGQINIPRYLMQVK